MKLQALMQPMNDTNVQCRNGFKARVLCKDRKMFHNGKRILVWSGLIEDPRGFEWAHAWYPCGRSIPHAELPYDLVEDGQ